jgi:hypothetical protein
MEKIVPLPGLTVKGPLGVAHLPRLWLKAISAAAGRLADGYVSGYEGTNKTVLDGLGLDPNATLAYLGTRPSYTQFELWVREHAARLDAASIAATNAAVVAHRKQPANAAEVRARVGVSDPSVMGAAVLNELDDWAAVHAAVTAPRQAAPRPIVPAVSTQSTGTLGLMHVPRLWMKATLAATGTLYPDWRSGRNSPLDMWFCEAIGLDVDVAIAHIQTTLPPYVAFESWLGGQAARVAPAEIAAHNAALASRQKPEEVAARERVVLGIGDPAYRPSMELNDLVDWHTVHAEIAMAGVPEAR